MGKWGVLFLIILACSNKGERIYYVVNAENPEYRKNTAFKEYEDTASPKFQELITRYRLDTLLKGQEDEFSRILVLKEWIHSVIPINDHGDPYPGDGYVERILDAAKNGTGFHCGHFMKVQNAVLNAFGYVTRTLGAGPGVAGVVDGHHGINETWVNSFRKWVLLDAKYNHYFEKEGIPLSALEVREEYLRNKAADIYMVKGIDRVKTEFDSVFHRTKESFARTYTWVEYHTYNNMFTAWPDHKTSLTVYADEYFNSNVWIWGDKPHWAYSKPEFMIKEPDRDALEWTPNTIFSQVEISGKKAYVKLTSDTPNLKNYQMKVSREGRWEPVSDRIELNLTANSYEIRFRTVNRAGICGPEHIIVIKSGIRD